jgi:hypothetical protein
MFLETLQHFLDPGMFLYRVGTSGDTLLGHRGLDTGFNAKERLRGRFTADIFQLEHN